MLETVFHRCHDHELDHIGRCPLCEDGVEPVRFSRARAQFLGVPLPGTVDVLPHHNAVSFEDVVRTVALQLAELELRQLEAVKPFQESKRAIYRTMRGAQMEPRTFNRAVRAYLGFPGAEAFRTDPGVQAVLSVMGEYGGPEIEHIRVK